MASWMLLLAMNMPNKRDSGTLKHNSGIYHISHFESFKMIQRVTAKKQVLNLEFYSLTAMPRYLSVINLSKESGISMVILGLKIIPTSEG